MGQSIWRLLSPEGKLNYEIMTDSEKNKFRLEWCEALVKDVYVEKHTIQQWQRVNRKLGEYVSPSMVWRLEGGTIEDKEPAARYIAKAMQVGPPFCAYNDRTER